MSRNLAAVGLLLLATKSFAGEIGETRHVYLTQVPEPFSPVSIASAPRNGLVLTWSAAGADGSQDIFYGSYSSFFIPSPIRLNTTTTGDQVKPRIAGSAVTGYVVVWTSGEEIYARQIDKNFAPVGADIQVDSVKGTDANPAIAADAFGNFIVVWQHTRKGVIELVGQRFLADSTPVGKLLEISTPTTNPSGTPTVSMAAWGEFVVAWESLQGTRRDTYVAAFAADGAPLMAPTAAGITMAQERHSPAAAMDAHGGFVVAWNNTDTAGSSSIQARQFLPGGTAAATEFTVNQASVDAQSAPAAGMDASGDFVVSWDRAAAFERELAARLLAKDGTPHVAEMTLGPGWLTAPTAAMDADGDSAIAAAKRDGDRIYVVAETLVGPEPIDTAVTISESTDPAIRGGSVRYTVTGTNTHPASTETGIAEIDSAIGWIPWLNVYVDVFAYGDAAYSSPCYPDYWSYHQQLCQLSALDAGGSRSIFVDVTDLSQPSPIWIGAQSYADYYARNTAQYDPDITNDRVEETTAVVCPDGSPAGVVRIARAPTTINEGETGVVEIERAGGTCGEARVQTTTAAGQLRWTDGEAGVKTVTVSNPQDNIDKDPGNAIVRLYLPQGGITLGNPSQVLITLADDEPEPTISISPVSATYTEGSNNYSFTFVVSLSHRSYRNPWVRFALGGTATRDSDYRLWSPTSDRIDFGAALSAPITIHGTNDSAAEKDETVTVTLLEPEKAVLSSQVTATLTIKDNDIPIVSIIAGDMTVSEGGTSNTVMIALSKSTNVPVTVPLNWSGSATRGSDFSAPNSVTIPAGSFQAYLNIPVLPDGLDEDAETAQLTLGQPADAELGADTSFTLSLTDMDPTPTIKFVDVVQSGTEGESIALAAELSAISGRAVRVVLLASGQAQLGSDFTMSNEAIVIPAGTKVSGPVLNITDDGQIETPETVKFTMDSATNALPYGQTEQTIAILDNKRAITP